MADRSNRRQGYMVDPRVRTFYFVTWALAVALLGVFGTLVWSIRTGMPAIQRTIPLPSFLGMNVLLWVGILSSLLMAGVILLAVYTTLQTHRVLGAAYRIHLTLEQLKEGEDPEPITLRPGDYLEEIASDLNELIESRG